MKIRGYVKGESYFCVEHHRQGSEDEPLEEVPPQATCTECQRFLDDVADEQETRQEQR